MVSVLILISISPGCTEKVDEGADSELDEYFIDYSDDTNLLVKNGYTREGNSTIILQNFSTKKAFLRNARA